MGKRCVSAWHRLESGEKVRETHLTFADLPAMLKALSPKRLELLRAVHRQPAPSIKALAIRSSQQPISSRTDSSLIKVNGDVRSWMSKSAAETTPQHTT